MKRGSGLLLIFALVLGGLGAGAEAAEMTLDNYLREVLLKNHSLKAGIRSVEAAYYSVLSEVAVQRPKLDITASGSWLSGQEMMGRKATDITAGSAGLLLTHRFDISGVFSLDEKQRILGYEIQRAQFDAGLNSLMASAEQTWWSTVLARENVRLQRDILRQRSENNRVTMEKFRQQLVPKLDVVRSEAQVVEAESLVKEAETLYSNALANLSFLAGGIDAVPQDEPLFVPVYDVDVSYEEALNFRPDVRGARLGVKRAELVEKLRKKGSAPTLDLGVQWTAWADPELSGTPQEGEAAAALKLNIPVIDGNKTKYGAMSGSRTVASAQENLQALMDQTRRDMAVARNNWKKAAAAQVDKKRQVERAEEELRITELMYSEGMGAQIDLINAQTAYQGVRTAYLNAVKEMYIALVELRKAVGDYSPAEDGSWKEAVKLYGRGRAVSDELARKSLRDSRVRSQVSPTR